MFTLKSSRIDQFAAFTLTKQQALQVKGGNSEVQDNDNVDTIIEEDIID